MKLRASNSLSGAGAIRRRAAFSLIEVLVVTGLLSVIILGLVLMFSQTQRAYKLGTTQVDVLEGGRMVTDIMTRDLQQLTPAKLSATNVLNFYVRMRDYAPLVQNLPGSTASRTNVLQDLFFLTRENQQWTAVAYFVRTNDNYNNLDFPQGTSGSLYRFATNYTEAFFKQYPNQFWADFLLASFDGNRASRMLDGVVQFKVRAYDPAGFWINTNLSANIYTNAPSGASAYYPFRETGDLLFLADAVPASVEIELGVLESKEIERARSITAPVARANYLSQQAGKVHLFRWRVPIRNFDPVAYQ